MMLVTPADKKEVCVDWNMRSGLRGRRGPERVEPPGPDKHLGFISKTADSFWKDFKETGDCTLKRLLWIRCSKWVTGKTKLKRGRLIRRE